MKACTFFGNRDTPREVETHLNEAILNLIENHEVDRFYIGTHGSFDVMVYRQLTKLELSHKIRFYVVLAYLPTKESESVLSEDSHTVIFEGMETVPPRYAIVKRNQWMLEQSDYVITYIRDQTGGAARFKSLAQKKGKTVIELYSPVELRTSAITE